MEIEQHRRRPVPTVMLPSTVYLIDEHCAHRQAMCRFLRSLDVQTHVFADIPNFLRWVDYDLVGPASCVVTEIDLPGLSGVDLIDVLRADEIAMPTVLMGCGVSVDTAVEAMHNGAAYVLRKPVARRTLARAIARARLHPSANGALALPSADVRRRVSRLTRRQRQLLRHVFEGRTNREIARQLNISVKTVEQHRATMMEAMGARSLAHLIRSASRCADAFYGAPQ